MGEVYRAKDTKLGREVAIKLLLEEVSEDPERLARFEREARVLASLNHPNVATLHGFETVGDTSFLVMELVEGETLGDRIARGPIPISEAIAVFLRIADGLEAAHASGIIHRDLKPANIKLPTKTPGSAVRSAGGAVKILDFGLATAMAPVTASDGDAAMSMSPTLTLAATQRGEIMGTAAYMSPEQAAGEEVDKRSDIWSFGVCLYEALTGKRLFDADKMSMVLAAVLRDEPDLDTLPDGTPPSLVRLLRRCLEKDADRRLHDIADARLDLEEEPTSVAVVHELGRPSSSVPLTVAATLIAALVAGSAAWLLKPAAPAPVVHTVVNSGANEPVMPSLYHSDVAISSDGQTVVYSVADGLYVRHLDEIGGRPLTGSEGGAGPFFSPDDQWVGFQHQRTSELRKVSIDGGPPVRVANIGGILGGASWAPDDFIYYSLVIGGGSVERVPAAGGEPEVLDLSVPEGVLDMRFPHLLPDSRALVVTLFEDSLQIPSLGIVSLDTGEVREIVARGSDARYVESGHLVFGFDSSLLAVRFDLGSLETRGNPVPVLHSLSSKASVRNANFAVSSSGNVVYIPGGDGAGAQAVLLWLDRDGEREPISLEAGPWQYPSLSPDGRRLALSEVGLASDNWIWDFERESLSRSTFGDAADLYARWTDDAQSLFYTSLQSNADIYRRAADGTGDATLVWAAPGNQFVSSVAPDGESLVYREGAGGSFDLGRLDLSGEPEGALILAGDYDELNGEISPDGRWLAYESNESGSSEIYVRPYPEVDTGRWEISNQGGIHPVWSPNGESLLFRSPEPRGTIYEVSIETEPSFRSSAPRVLLEEAPFMTGIGRTWDVHPDGKRFLILAPSSSTGGRGPDVVLVQNFFEELQRLVPVD
jgi:serine/threonine-protein kinase